MPVTGQGPAPRLRRHLQLDTSLLRSADWSRARTSRDRSAGRPSAAPRRRSDGRSLDVAALSVLKTFDPPISALQGRTVTGAQRWGKYLGLQVGQLFLIAHLSRAGWLRWSDNLAAAPLRPGKGPIALRVHLGTPGSAPGFDLTEAGTQKRLAVWLVDDPKEVPGISALGPDALDLGPDDLAGLLAGNTGRIKTVITDQKVIAGSQRLQRRNPARRQDLAVRHGRETFRRTTRHPGRRDDFGADGRGEPVGRPGGGHAQGREALRTAGARPHRIALPGVRGHRA